MPSIEGKSLTTFEVAPDGATFQLRLNDAKGQPTTLTLPAECLNELVMTMPRIAAETMRAKYRDESLRLVYPVGDWKIESAAGDLRFILTLKTPDGFEVAFALNRRDFVVMLNAMDDEARVDDIKERALN